MEKKYKEFGDVLRHILNKGKIRQTDLALVLGVSRQQIGRWVQGQNMPSDDLIKKMEKFFSLPENSLFDIKETVRRQTKILDVFSAWENSFSKISIESENTVSDLEKILESKKTGKMPEIKERKSVDINFQIKEFIRLTNRLREMAKDDPMLAKVLLESGILEEKKSDDK